VRGYLDWPLYRSLFTDDAHIDYSAAGLGSGTPEEVIPVLSEQQAGITIGMDYVTNIESQIDGDVARVLAMWFNAVRLPDVAKPLLRRPVAPLAVDNTRVAGGFSEAMMEPVSTSAVGSEVGSLSAAR
jgi:hypothetical protein